MAEEEELDIWQAQSFLRRRRYSRCIDLCTKGLEKRPNNGQLFWLKARAIVLGINDFELPRNQSKPPGPTQTDLINMSSINLKKFVRVAPLAKSLLDYLLASHQNLKSALELATMGALSEENDWWWRAILGRSCFELGLVNEAEREMKRSLELQYMVRTVESLIKYQVYNSVDRPEASIQMLQEQLSKNPNSLFLHENVASICEDCSEDELAAASRKRILEQDPSNTFALATLASTLHSEPEKAIQFYRRLQQVKDFEQMIGLEIIDVSGKFQWSLNTNNMEFQQFKQNDTAIWNNMGVCVLSNCLYQSSIKYFERALEGASEEAASEIWHNIGQLGVQIGDLDLACRSFQVALSSSDSNIDSLVNLDILRTRIS